MNGKSKLYFGWKFWIVSFMLVATIILSIILIRTVQVQKIEISNLNSKIDMIINSVRQNNLSVKNNEISLQPYYSAISEKMDNTISEIITLVTIIMGISTASGLILAFKAPRDIENEIVQAKQVANIANEAADYAKKAAVDAKKAAEELNKLVSATSDELNEKVSAAEKSSKEASNAAKEAKSDAAKVKFEVDLKDAMSKDSDKEKKKAIAKLETKYPNESRVFINKGKLSRNAKDAKIAFDEARKLGFGEPDYYNELAHIYYDLEDYDQAIDMISKGLEIEKNCGLYVNMARTLCSKSESNQIKDDDNLNWLYEALKYLTEAEKANNKDQQIYLWRARIINNIIFHFTTEEDYSGEFSNSITAASKIDYERAQRFVKKMSFDFGEGRLNYKDDRTLSGNALTQLAELDVQRKRYYSAFENLYEAFYAYFLPTPRCEKYSQVPKYAAEVIAMFESVEAKKALNLVSGQKDKLYLSKIGDAAIEMYKEGKRREAGKVFTFLYATFGKDSARDCTAENLIFMMRRGEIKATKKHIESLIASIVDSKSLDAQINIYLWKKIHIQDKADEVALLERFYSIRYSEKSIEKAIEWWSDIKLVGEDESAIVLGLLSKLNEYNKDLQ